MVKSISTIEGLGGCGKTFYFLEKCQELLYQGKPIVYLTFNKRIAEKTIQEVKDNRVWISTIHSLMYQELDQAQMLPERPSGFDDGETDSKEAALFFKNVEKTFLKYFQLPNYQLSIIKDKSTIFVDEYQNIVETNLKECLKLIGDKLNIDYCFIGDRYQTIYGYLCHGRNNFDEIEKDFGRAIDDRIILRVNHRSNDSVLGFINSFLKKNVEIEDKFLYQVQSIKPIEKQKLFFFTNRKDEFTFVKDECLRLYSNGEANITILSRWKRNLKYFKEWIEQEKINWIEASTIHGYIGNEKDTIFIVGLEYPETLEEKMVLYTGLIRAEERLVLTTSFPQFDNTKIANEEFLEVTNLQELRSKPFKQLKMVKKNKNLTLGKFEKCMIDSIGMTVRGADVPFIPYIEHNGIHGADSFVKSLIDHDGATQIRIEYHKPTKHFTFKMKDVNPLRRSGFTDIQVIYYLINKVIEYFHYQVPLEDIKLTSIDLCRVVPNEDDLVKKILANRLKCKQVRTHLKGDKPIKLITKADLDEGTIYFNFTSPKTLTMAMYHPFNKENGNRYFNKEVTKVELRVGINGISREYAFGRDVDMEWLLGMVKGDEGYLRSVFDKILASRKK